MATRSVTGTILKPDGSPWKSATFKFHMLNDAYTLGDVATYPIKVLTATTDSDGLLSVTLAAGVDVVWEVTGPDDEVFYIYVPEGTATTLEALRFAYDGVSPIPPPDLQGYVESVLEESAIVREVVEDYLGNAVQDSTTIDATYSDISGQLTLDVKANTSQQKVGVRKNSAGSTFVRQRVNLIEGSNVTLTVSDDSGSDEVDVTIAASGGSTIAVKEANSNVVAAASSIDFTGADFNVTDGGSGRAVIALAGTLGGSIELKEANVQVIAAMTALDFDGTHFNVADSGSGRGTITLASPGGGGGGGSGATTQPGAYVFQEGAADSTALVAVGTKGYIRAPYDATITGYTILTDVSATVTLDVWKIASGTALPTNSNSITASAKPTLTADDVVHSTTLTGWTTAVTAGDILAWEVEANNNAHLIVFLLEFDHTVVNQYTNEDARDAIGAALTDSTSIDFTVNDGADTITAAVIYGGSGGNNGTAATAARSDHAHSGVYAAASHTHTGSDITDFVEVAQDAIGAMVVDTTTVNATYTDATPELKFDVIDNTSTQKVLVNKAGGTAVGPRHEINFIEGSGMTITVADDGPNDRVNVTLASSGGGGGGTLDIKEGNSGLVAAASALDFDASDFNIADAGSGRATVALAYGTSAGTPAEGNHTHTSAAITDFNEAAQDAVGGILTDSTAVDFTYNDASNTISAALLYAGSGGDYGSAATPARSDHNHDLSNLTNALEFIQDAINSTVVDGVALTKSYNDALNQYTLDVDLGTGSGQAAAGNHTHTSGAVSDFTEAAQDAVGAMVANSTSINLAYVDATPSLTATANFSGSGSASTIARSDHTHTVTKSLNFPFGDEDGLGAVIATTARRTISIPVGWGTCTITRWRVLLDQSSTTTFDIWKDSYANYPPTNADSITASAKPSTSAATKNESTSLTGWTTTFTGGDVLTVEVEANNNAKWGLLTVEFTMTAV